jgi:hypothetical protein
MQDAIADTNNSAPGTDRLSYNMFKHLSEKTISIFVLVFTGNSKRLEKLFLIVYIVP